MKKVFSILMVAFAMTAMVACGDKVNGTDNPTPDNPTGQNDYLPAGIYSYYYDNVRTDDHVLSILFDDEHDFTYTIFHGHDVEEIEDDESWAFQGEYELSSNSGKGILRLYNSLDGSDAGTAEFTYDHNNSITVTFMGETVTLVKALD